MNNKIEKIESALSKLELPLTPAGLYEPIRYILSLGGKRMRPVLVLMGNELFDGDENEVIPQAIAVELFHNFSLIHDDIMDRAPIRRGKQTVHKKWNENTAILSGDGMLVLAYQQLAKCDEKYLRDILDIFSKMAMEVCEGQQFDMEFETRNDVSIEEYIRMISLKTAVLLGAALETGAVIAGAEKKDAEHLYEFGKNLGIAFQLQDDLLDAYGDESKFGKKSGGDIAVNKKTFLLLTAMRDADSSQKEELQKCLDGEFTNEEEKINRVLSVFNELNIYEKTRTEMESYFNSAMEHLKQINVPEEKKTPLSELAHSLMVREH